MAEEKITQKPALTTPAGGDLLYIVDDPSGTPVGKKITLTNLFENVPGTIDLADITDNNIPYMSASGFADSPLSTDGIDLTATGGLNIGGDMDAGDNDLHNLKQVDYQDVHANGNSGASITINWNEGNNQDITLTGDCTFAFTTPAGPCHLTLVMVGDGTSRALTWPATVDWGAAGEPTWTATASAKNIVSFFYDGTDYIARGSAG